MPDLSQNIEAVSNYLLPNLMSQSVLNPKDELLKRIRITTVNADTRDPWDVVKELQGTYGDDGRPVAHPHVLPRYVYRLPFGRKGFGARTGRGPDAIRLPGPFATPEDAHLGMVAKLARRRG